MATATAKEDYTAMAKEDYREYHQQLAARLRSTAEHSTTKAIKVATPFTTLGTFLATPTAKTVALDVGVHTR
jgi:hypothetical protein